MAGTGSLIPAQMDMHAINGADFSCTLALFADLASTIAFDLTGYSAIFTVGGPPGAGLFNLSIGSGIAVGDPTLGKLLIVLSNTQTASVPSGPQHYSLQLTDGAGAISYPINGTLFFTQP